MDETTAAVAHESANRTGEPARGPLEPRADPATTRGRCSFHSDPRPRAWRAATLVLARPRGRNPDPRGRHSHDCAARSRPRPRMRTLESAPEECLGAR